MTRYLCNHSNCPHITDSNTTCGLPQVRYGEYKSLPHYCTRWKDKPLGPFKNDRSPSYTQGYVEAVKSYSSLPGVNYGNDYLDSLNYSYLHMDAEVTYQAYLNQQKQKEEAVYRTRFDNPDSWKCSEERSIKILNMETPHILNTLKLFLRKPTMVQHMIISDLEDCWNPSREYKVKSLNTITSMGLRALQEYIEACPLVVSMKHELRVRGVNVDQMLKNYKEELSNVSDN